MSLVDTHTHLYLPEFAPSPGDAVGRAIDAGIDMMIFPNVDLSTIALMKKLAGQFPDNVRMAMGLHPTEVGDDWHDSTVAVLDELCGDGRYVAVGEIGIDLYWDKSFRDQQMQSFEMQASMAAGLGKPIIVHCRNGLDEALEVLQGIPGSYGVFHSFGGDLHDVEKIRRVGDFYFGINGIVTFKNSRLRDILPEIGIGRLLLETDSPYLAPVPHRGKRNESAFMVHTAAYVADVLNVSCDKLASATTENADRLFKLGLNDLHAGI